MPIENRSANRRGPSPLSVNIGLAMAEYGLLQGQDGADKSLLPVMLAGIKAYQAHPFKRAVPAYTEIWREGEARLLRHTKACGWDRTLVMVPSLINRSAILDLMPRRSLMRFLESRGYDVLLLDWGNPVNDPQMLSDDALVTRRLVPALQAARVCADGRPVDVLGYCMGGVLVLAACCVMDEVIGKIALLGTPWDFHAGDGRLLRHIAAGTPAAFQGMAERGHLPRGWVQSVFAALNADRAARKFADFAVLDQGGARAKLFVAVEDWLNDGVDLPANLARTCIADWYGGNLPARKQWRIGGRVIDPAQLANNILVVAANRDRLVPPASSLALIDTVRHADVLRPDSGHIGMMAGQGARGKVWAPVADWLDR